MAVILKSLEPLSNCNAGYDVSVETKHWSEEALEVLILKVVVNETILKVITGATPVPYKNSCVIAETVTPPPV